MATASPQQLTEIFKAFDVTITYDKATERLRLAATITPELLAQNDDRSGERSRMFGVAGAGLITKPATGPAAQGTLAGRPKVAALAHRIEEWWPLGREVGWLRELGDGAA